MFMVFEWTHISLSHVDTCRVSEVFLCKCYGALYWNMVCATNLETSFCIVNVKDSCKDLCVGQFVVIMSAMVTDESYHDLLYTLGRYTLGWLGMGSGSDCLQIGYIGVCLRGDRGAVRSLSYIEASSLCGGGFPIFPFPSCGAPTEDPLIDS
ncbi:hypothetical protein GOP47_0024216 [Adiantum capillus-veneris]|uniref:Uncharacterized protein n=1 Tax=Adiantum capillus-veneris TaxID=13818 RepID=A0A9D4U7F8_ADICA|nr:hypothetical protein GOP47_0024216 [Adiantum capillus-veneris]